MFTNVYIPKIEKVFKPKYFVVYAMYDMGNRVLFGIKNKKYINDEPLDPWYTIDKKTGKIEGFAPHMEKEAFKQAINNPIKL